MFKHTEELGPKIGFHLNISPGNKLLSNGYLAFMYIFRVGY